MTALRPGYKTIAELAQQIQVLLLDKAIPVNELSMEMSGDTEVAIEEGATIVRVGTAMILENENILIATIRMNPNKAMSEGLTPQLLEV